MIQFNLRFDPSQFHHWADEYNQKTEDEKVLALVPAVRQRGYLTAADLRMTCDWKSPRSRAYVERNDADFIRVITETALSTSNERLRIEVLALLDGVRWPTASTILHFFHGDPYPILDYRALWSLGIDKPPVYNFDFWWAYVQHCRSLAQQAGLSMREVDRALWWYSKVSQNV